MYLIVLSIKQGGIKYHFLSFWYDYTWDWTPVSQAMSRVFANGPGDRSSIPGHKIWLLPSPTDSVTILSYTITYIEHSLFIDIANYRFIYRYSKLYYWLKWVYIYIYIYTHTHIFIYTCVCMHNFHLSSKHQIYQSCFKYHNHLVTTYMAEEI